MHYFVALAASLLVAASGHGGSNIIQKTADVSDTTEVYVAQLDTSWDVAREIRVPCSIDLGCSVDLGLAGSKLARVHVQFDPLRNGEIAVSSVTEDQSGRALRQPDLSLHLDRSGFAAAHYEAGPAKAAVRDAPDASDQPIILMAVKAPAWAVPVGSLSNGADHT